MLIFTRKMKSMWTYNTLRNRFYVLHFILKSQIGPLIYILFLLFRSYAQRLQ